MRLMTIGLVIENCERSCHQYDDEQDLADFLHKALVAPIYIDGHFGAYQVCEVMLLW